MLTLSKLNTEQKGSEVVDLKTFFNLDFNFLSIVLGGYLNSKDLAMLATTSYDLFLFKEKITRKMYISYNLVKDRVVNLLFCEMYYKKANLPDFARYIKDESKLLDSDRNPVDLENDSIALRVSNDLKTKSVEKVNVACVFSYCNCLEIVYKVLNFAKIYELIFRLDETKLDSLEFKNSIGIFQNFKDTYTDLDATMKKILSEYKNPEANYSHFFSKFLTFGRKFPLIREYYEIPHKDCKELDDDHAMKIIHKLIDNRFLY